MNKEPIQERYDNAVKYYSAQSSSEEYLQFINWIRANAPRVLLMQEFVSEQQCKNLNLLYRKGDIKDTLLDMHNYMKLYQTYVSAYITLRSWIRRNNDKYKPATGQRIGQIMQPEDEEKRLRIIERLRNAGSRK